MRADWNTVSLGDLLTVSRVPVSIEDMTAYEQVTVAIKGRGLRRRGVVSGSEIKTKRQFGISTDQLLVSKIDARNGAIGIVPPELDGAIVSGDFPVFDIDKELCTPTFLDLYVRRAAFWDECLLVSEGSTNRVRLVPEQFLELEAELPPLSEQQAIIAALAPFSEAERAWEKEAAMAKAAHAAGRVALIEDSEGETLPLGEIVHKVEGGKSPKCLDRRPVDDEYGVLKVSAIRDGSFRADEAKALPATTAPWAQTVRAGDLLYGRANTSRFVGAMCKVERDFPRLLLCDKTMRMEVDEGQVYPDFLVEAVGAPSAREHIELMAGGTSDSMKNISQAAYLETEIVLPSLASQRRIAETLRVFRQAAHDAVEISERVSRGRRALADELVTGARPAQRLSSR